MEDFERAIQEIEKTPAVGNGLASKIYDLEARRVLAEQYVTQMDDFAKLIATGDFPLQRQAIGRFNLIPLGTAALERVDTLQRLSIQAPEEKLDRLTAIAEKVYRLRTEANGGDNYIEFYTALLQLGNALKINAGQLRKK